MKPLPEEIISIAFVSDDGEFAWQRQHILTALRSIAETGQAILGGDVWTVEEGKVCSLFPNTKGFRMWDTQPQKPDELWADYCLRTCDESIREIEKTQLEKEVNQEFQHYIFYYPTYTEQDDVKALIPRNKHDIERAEAAVKAGYPVVAPILPELLEWLQDMNWPVAGFLAPFLATIGKPLIPHIQRIFATDDEMWKYWIMTYIIADSVELATSFRDELERIAFSPTKREIEEELNETAQHILKEYGWLKPIS
jgi:hypothetical protein